MKTLILCFCFIGWVVCQRKIDYRLLGSKRFDYPPVKCTTPGYFCEDCNHVAICLQDENGDFTKKLSKCKEAETCLKNKCTAEANPFCDESSNFQFVCKMSGVFPDPLDCQKYHFCVPQGSGTDTNYVNYDASCDGGYGYNPLSTFCDVELENGKCSLEIDDLPVPICDGNNYSGALPGNPSLYYICETYENTDVSYPYLHACKRGGHYEDLVCKPKQPSVIHTVYY